MLIVAVLALLLWGVGWAMGAPRRLRWLMLALLYLAVIGALLVLPADAALRRALGGSASGWAVVGAAGLAVALYLRWLRRLRTRAASPPPPPPEPGAISDDELTRYMRHIMLREIGGPGQARLGVAKVLVVGAGGLGSPVLLYLAAAGVGRLTVVDDDIVDLGNLQRQILHDAAQLGRAKTASARTALAALNPHVAVTEVTARLEAGNADALIAGHDLVLDGSDSFATRYLVNAACARAGIPLIGGALGQWEGQVSLYDPARGGPCYRCVFPEAPAPGLAPSCAEAGVAGPLPGVIGSIMALEAVKHLTGAGRTLRGELLIFDGLYGESRRMHLHRRADCPDCAPVTTPAGPDAG